MSRALLALILLQVDARQGEWVALTDMAKALEMKLQPVHEAAQALADANQVHHAFVDGKHYYGVHVEGVAP